MTLWAQPPPAKVYEALTAVADGRVRLLGDGRAEVVSSTGEKTYAVSWSADGRTWSANDNASYWGRYAGYPILAVLLAGGRIRYDAGLAGLLAGVPWKRLNDSVGRDYERAVASVLADVRARGGDTEALVAEAEAIAARFAALGLERGPRPGRPPPGKPSAAGAPAAGGADTGFSRLTRMRQQMPDDVRAALATRGLNDAYHARPAYQQNDYLAWIARARRAETRVRRLQQMLDELAAGGVYMKMKHPPSRRHEGGSD